MKRTDRDWERWGASSPYYGVLSADRFRESQLSSDVAAEFFASGDAHVSSVLELISTDHGTNFRPNRVLDFGCGVGRLAIPFAKKACTVVGMDISDSMLAEALRNSVARDVRNIEFVRSDDKLTLASGEFDIVHSYIVLQHIHPARGHRLVCRLADKVRMGGYLAIQFYTACSAPFLLRALVKARYRFPPANWARNILKGRPVFEQGMQLHTYDLSKLLRTLRISGFSEVSLHLDIEGSGSFESIFLLSRRTGCAASVINPHA